MKACGSVMGKYLFLQETNGRIIGNGHKLSKGWFRLDIGEIFHVEGCQTLEQFVQGSG